MTDATKCPKCLRPIAPPGYTLSTHCGPLQETACDLLAKAYRRGLQAGVAVAKRHVRASVQAQGDDGYCVRFHWTAVEQALGEAAK